MKFLETQWETYRQAAFPPDTSAIQLKISRDVFYAGASILMTALNAAADKLSEDNGVKVLDHIDAELDAWRKEKTTP